MAEENGGDRASGHVTPGGDTDGDRETAEDVLREQSQRAFLENFPDLGIELDPTKGEIGDIIDFLLQEWQAIGSDVDWGSIGPDPWSAEYMVERQTEDFWVMADQMLAPYAGFGAPKEGEAERPGDPLGIYFQAVDRMLKTMTGPFPEARYFGAEGYRESFETLTPSSFDEYIKGQEEGLRAEFQAEAFLATDARMQQFGQELSGLEGDERYMRMLQLSETAGLGELPSYESFLAEKRPQLEQKYRYLKPLGDEPQKAWAGAFKDLFGAGAQVTPFSQFLGRKQEGLGQQYEDLVREQLRAGTSLGELPDLEEWFREQRPGIERSFRLSGPQYTGRTPTGVFKPKKRIM